MFFKVITIISLIFVLTVAVVFGQQLTDLASNIGRVDREEFLDKTIYAKPIPENFTTATINDYKLFVDVAQTPQERAQGLMYVEHMEYNRGMIFVFNREGNYSFWMKNTKIPLDIIWISEDLEIVHIEKDVPTCTELICPKYSSPVPAKFVLEVNAGWAKSAQIEPGMPVYLR